MKSNNPKVAFCVINYRTPEMTLAIIQNILNLNNFKKFNSKIFVLDNGSGDNSVDFLEQNLPKDESVELFICEKNLGFAGGQDYFKGHIAKYDYVAFIKEIKRVLKPDGLAIISTPNDIEYGEGNHFHIHEFEHKELLNLIERYFKNTKSYFQSTWKSVLMGELKDHESFSLDNVNLMNTDPLEDSDKTLYFYIICSNRSISEAMEKAIAIGPHLSESSEWSVRKQELAYIEELKKINQKGELLKQEITELRRSNSYKEEILDNILKSKKYKAVTEIAKFNKALKNPKMFIDKLKDVTHRK